MTIKMKAPNGCASISIDGETFPVSGNIAVIHKSLMKKAMEHGFKELEDLALEAEKDIDKGIKKSSKKGD